MDVVELMEAKLVNPVVNIQGNQRSGFDILADLMNTFDGLEPVIAEEIKLIMQIYGLEDEEDESNII